AITKMATTLQVRSEYIQSFARSVSHEFKTPLTAIDGAVELLAEHFDGMSADERRKFLSIIKDESQHMSRLVSKLLQLARADVVQPGDGSCALGEVFDDVLVKSNHHGRRLIVKLDGD